MVMVPEHVELVIEELILEGFPSEQRGGIRLAVERELGRLLLEHGLPQTLRQEADIGRLEVGMTGLDAGSGVDVIGARLARALYGGMGG